MSAAHTPGPWKIDEGNWIWGPDGFPIAACDPGAFEHNRAGECCANADLIAAAPELLGALQAILHETTHDNMGLTRDEALDLIFTVADIAHAAIQRAKGAP